jgi:hypothetical protein
MELKSFRELLLKKAVDNPTLQTIIYVMKDELIADKVFESLEKMADPQAGVGRNATAAVTAYGQGLTDSDVHDVHDALSHHVSHYKSALKNGKREVADQHLNKIIPLMHFITQAGKHSGGKLNLDYTSLRPWEMNYTSNITRKQARDAGLSNSPLREGANPNELHEETKGLDRRLKSGSRDKNPFLVPDYRYLEMPPHPGHKDKKVTHQGGYPFEDIQVGSHADTKAKRAHLDIEDIPAKDSFTPHPLDSHPALQLVESKTKQRNLGGKEQDLANSIKSWEETTAPEREQRLTDKYNKNPEGFATRGIKKPSHHFADIPLTKMPHHEAKDLSHLPPSLRAKHGESQKQTTAEIPAVPAAEVAPTISAKDLSHLPPSLRAKHGGGK